MLAQAKNRSNATEVFSPERKKPKVLGINTGTSTTWEAGAARFASLFTENTGVRRVPENIASGPPIAIDQELKYAAFHAGGLSRSGE